MNINCNGIKSIQRIPHTLKKLVNATLAKNQLLCSIDLTDTGITVLNGEVFENFNQFILELVKINKNHEKNTLKISFSSIDSIEAFRLPHLNTVLFVRDSLVHKIQPQSLGSNAKVELNFINVTTSSINWLNMLDSSRLKLLSLRNIPNMNAALISRKPMFPVTTIIDLKIYNTPLPLLDENFFFFKVIKYIEQMEFIGCSIVDIKNGTFQRYKARFRYLKSLILTNNNLTRIYEQTFSGLSNLVLLDLDENPIEVIEHGAFKNMKKLRTLSMNNNVKLISLMTNPVWLSDILSANQARTLSEISMKSTLWIEDFCLLQFLVTTFEKSSTKNFPLNGNKKYTNASGAMKPIDANEQRTKQLKLFFDDEIIENENDNGLYCNFFYMCKYAQGVSNSFWQIEQIGACANGLKVGVKENRCLFSEKVNFCESRLTG